MKLEKKGLTPRYGYNADAHSRFGLDYSTGRTMTPIKDENHKEPPHFVLRDVPDSMITKDYENYLNDKIYRIALPSDNAADRYLSLVDERECNITANENGKFDIDLGPDENNVFQANVDEVGDGSYKTKFMNAANIVKAYEKAMGKESSINKDAIVVKGSNEKGTMIYTSQEQPDGTFETKTLSQESNQPKLVLHGKDARGNEFDYISQEQPDGTFKTEQFGE